MVAGLDCLVRDQVRGRQAPARFAAIQFDIRGLGTALQAVDGEG